MAFFWIALVLGLTLILSFRRSSLRLWVIAFSLYWLAFAVLSSASFLAITLLGLFFLVIFVPLACLPLRRSLVSERVLKQYRKLMPRMSSTEREALTAGTVGWEGELFTGMPSWDALRAIPEARLTEEEQAFLEGPVETLCASINNWSINHEQRTIPESIWSQLKSEGFFGLIIPKSYGGKGFSALAHSQIIAKVASISTAVATVVSVPNSLGPAELLLHYGTASQKDYYLPRLASGQEIPCFALTSPEAGSDASSLIDSGVVCREVINGETQLAIRLQWNKRYITLAPVATVLGLAFKLYDPDHLLGEETALGITCALIPVETEGVTIGRRHYPLCSAFPNGPTQGENVLIRFDHIIGGQAMIGQGWRMLMECLAAGRSISLPSMSAGGMKSAVFTTGAYARIRQQFNVSISAFGGIQEALARLLGNAYRAEALRLFTVSALDRGQKPAVASAISKYHTTQLGRSILCDAMDIHGGKAIQMGPNNYLAQFYIESPIAITVEGANILTRSLIIFGQGAVRCHPYVLAELKSAEDQTENGLAHFDRAFFAHAGFLLSNKVRTFLLGLTKGRLAKAPSGALHRYYQQFSRFSSVFAFLSDVSMLVLGAALKREEQLSARLGDVLSLLYIASAVMKYYEWQKEESAWPLLQWVCDDLLFQIQNQLLAFLNNFPISWMGRCLKRIIFPWGCSYQGPSDTLVKAVSSLIVSPSKVREKLVEPLYSSDTPNNPIGKLNAILQQVIAAEPLERKMRQAERDGLITGMGFFEKLEAAIAAKVFSVEEAQSLRLAHEARLEFIQVDDFSSEKLAI